jgi:hypothetical protein
LDRVRHLEVEVSSFRTDGDDSATDVVNFILGGVTAEEENALSHAPMRVHAEESFAYMMKHDVQNRVGCELMQLHAIDKEKPMKEFMGRGERYRGRLRKERVPER